MDHQRVFDQEIDEMKENILNMGKMVGGLIHKSIEALKNLDVKLAKDVVDEDEKVDRLELEIDEKAVQLVALRQPKASDLRFLMTGMRIATDIERIGDLAGDIAERVIELAGQPPQLKPLIDIPQMAKLAEDGLDMALNSFINKDPAKAKTIWKMEKESDNLRDRIYDELMEIMAKDPKTVSRAIPILIISRHLERISDHTTNIAEDVVYMAEGKVVKHSGG